jgi:hypothetical protein
MRWAHKYKTVRTCTVAGNTTHRMMDSTLMAAFSSFCCARRLAISRCVILPELGYKGKGMSGP